MALVKKVVTAAVCGALLVAGGVFGMNTIEVYGGAGNGINAKVNKLETLKEVLDDIDEIRASSKSTARLQTAAADKESLSYYKSFSWIETAEAYISSENSYSNDNYTNKSSKRVDFSRTLEMYFGEKESFYVAELWISSASTYETNNRSAQSGSNSTKITETSKYTLSGRIEYYFSEDCAMFCFKKLNYSEMKERKNSDKPNDTDETYMHSERDTEKGKLFTVLKEYCNRWIDCSEEPGVVSAFLAVDSVNLKSLRSFGNLIENEVNSEMKGLKQSGNAYALKKESFLSFFGLPEKADGKCIIDLSNDTSPLISYWFSYADKDDKSGDSGYGSGYSRSNDVYSYIKADNLIKNINNTVVRKPDKNLLDFNVINDRIKEMGDK